MAETENIDEYKHEWVDHPYTKYMRANAARDRDAALATLIQTAAASSDPKVLIAYASWLVADKKTKALETGNK